MMKKNKIIKIATTNKCKKCTIFFNIIDNYIKQNHLEIKIKKIESVSDDAINLAMQFDIDKIPFAIYGNKKLVFSDQISIGELEQFLT